MDGLSKKQNLFLGYLIERLGFKQDSILDSYLIRLNEFASHVNHIQKRDKYEKCSIVDLLVHEYNFRKIKDNFELKYSKKSTKVVSATDLSTFTFCPASYAISKTYETKTTVSESIGTLLHEENILLNRFKIKDFDVKYDENKKSLITEENKYFFDDIKASTLIYSVNLENSDKYFLNSDNNYVGQPDYVFQNSEKINFIVEEKFRPETKVGVHSFYENYKIQLLSYIYKLNNFNAEYGYLIYWFYNKDINVVECKALKITRSIENEKRLNGIIEATVEFNNRQTTRFYPNELNASKCVNCSVKNYCGHKTGKFESITLPYDIKYSQLNSAKFPSELSKKPAAHNIIESVSDKTVDGNKNLLNNLNW